MTRNTTTKERAMDTNGWSFDPTREIWYAQTGPSRWVEAPGTIDNPPAFRPGTLTTADLDRMELDERWLGNGYIGERNRRRNAGDDTTAADDRAVAAANAAGLDYDAFLAWANSQHGRWYGDCMFGSPDGRHADLYEPGAPAWKRAR